MIGCTIYKGVRHFNDHVKQHLGNRTSYCKILVRFYYNNGLAQGRLKIITFSRYQKCSREVGLHDGVPALEGEVLSRRRKLTTAVVHEEVDPAVVRQNLRDGVPEGRTHLRTTAKAAGLQTK